MLSVAEGFSQGHVPARLFSQRSVNVAGPSSSLPERRRSSSSERKLQVRQEQKRWVAEVARLTGLTFTEIARRADMDPSTITTFMRKDDAMRTLHQANMLSISEALGIALPSEAPASGGFLEAEAAPYVAAEGDPLQEAIGQLCRDANRFPYALRSDVLIHEGYRPGDILIVDMAAEPKEGDIVCAQFYGRNDLERTETVFRLLSRRYLLASGPHDAAREPREIMDASVRVMGAVVAMLRPRR